MADSSARVLVADDEPSLLRMVDVYLRRIGCSVTTTERAEAVPGILDGAGVSFDLVVLDATMAGVDLPEFAAALFAASPTLRILVTSGYPVDIAPLAGVANGRLAFLQKPFGPEALAGAVWRILGKEETRL